jgi:signal transduction histidine kinase
MVDGVLDLAHHVAGDEWPLDAAFQVIVAALVGLYNLALRAPVQVACWGFVLLVADTALGAKFLARDSNPLTTIVLVTLIAFAVFTLAFTFRTRREYLAALEERAARLETDRHQRAQLAAVAERARVAREMHDILGHNLSVVVGLADGGAALAASGNERAEQPLRLIGDTARQALAELRRVLGVLRERPEDPRLAPQPGVAELETQLARVRAAGLRVTYHTEGDLEALGGGVQLTIYRIVQEALTNTLKHAGAGATARVSVTTEGGAVRVRVADGGPPPGAERRAGPAGRDGEPGNGLVGVRQRAFMYGGSVTAGPQARGWLVDVLLKPGAVGEPRREPRQ